ncbi:MAG TPA: hypothetical protein PK523_09570, partial [Elusimicrobiales bacterium]|nr:hypothetical protein [Elusimicrobiales bacterium]
LSCAVASVMSFTYRRVPSAGAALFAGISTLIVSGSLPSGFRPFYWAAAAGCGLAELAVFLRAAAWRAVLPGAGAMLVMAAVLVPYFALEYSQPFNGPRLLSAQVHIDTFYHVAIAAMLKTHGAVSHGLHGLGQLDYHFGSHLLMAAASRLSGLSVFDVYNYAFVFLIIPLLCFSVIAVAEELSPSESDRDFLVKLLVYGWLMLGTGVLLKDSFLHGFALWPSFFESESYAFSLALLLSLVSVLGIRPAAVSFWLRAGFIFALLILLPITKISTGLCAVGFIFAWALFPGAARYSREAAGRWGVLFACGFLFFFLLRRVNPGMSDAELQPLQFISGYVSFPGPLWLKSGLFLVLHFIFPIAALLFYFLAPARVKNKGFLPGWWALGTGFSLAGGIAVVFLFYITGGAGYYFSNISMFAALPALLCVPGLMRAPKGAGPVKSRAGKAIPILLLSLAVLAFSVYAPRALRRGKRAFLNGMAELPPATALAGYVEKLLVIRDDPTSAAGVVHIPRSEKAYWESMYCKGTGYFIPAISERPALYAWPSRECYDFLCGPRFHSNGLCEASQGIFTDAELMAEAAKLGFDPVYVVTALRTRTLVTGISRSKN